MAIEQRVANVGFCTAATDLSTKQFRIVKVTAALAVNLTTVKGEAAFGILQNKPKSGEAADVWTVAVSKVVAGTGGLAAAASYEADTDGSAVTAEAGKVGLGTVLIGANAGELATVTVGMPCGAVIHA